MMEIQNQRRVMLTPYSNLHIPQCSAEISMEDLNLGTQNKQGQCVEHAVDCDSQRPVGFIHRNGHVELLNRALLSDLADQLDAEESVVCDLIPISEVTEQEEMALRFWHGERAWCQQHRRSRYNPQMLSWQDIVRTLFENEVLARAVAHCLLGRQTLRLIDIEWLCAERAAVSTISEYQTQLQETAAA
ncbi:hypothetical protein [Halomonas smyrnensis]|uniref:hypothetical protein n=1 Tax=Halomonas smyrnensis TaxID=720605 RepID=UPI000373BA02|nr:hypothetical protein [Halomonas smyrnensis]